MSDLGRPAEYRVYGLLDASTGQFGLHWRWAWPSKASANRRQHQSQHLGGKNYCSTAS